MGRRVLGACWILAGPLALGGTAQEASRSTATAHWHVVGEYYFADPWFLGLIPLVLMAYFLGRSRRRQAVGHISALPIDSLPKSWPQRLNPLPVLCQVLALCLVAVALARPLRGNVLESTTSEGVDIALVLDRSSSMGFPDMDQDATRLDVVKEVVGEFAERRMTDTVGASDKVALISFARFPQLHCPFTLDAGALLGFLEDIEMVEYQVEDGTGVGIALGKAVAVLRETDARSKVVVLLTDGENNIDEITPESAAVLAAEEGIRVYTVLAGRYQFQRDFQGRAYPVDVELDATELERIAEITGGQFFRAKDRDGLEQVYADIETLERTPRVEERFTETYDLYTYVLLPALWLYLLGWVSVVTWARRLP